MSSAASEGATIYRGRFAPSPTGDLHFGSLVAAVGSYLDARANGGEWLVRIDDLDPPREVPGSVNRILHTLETLGFGWDREVIYQSQRHDSYRERIEQLRREGRVYACQCTRREIAAAGRAGADGPVYPGTCRLGGLSWKAGRSLRLLTRDEPVEVTDRIQGTVAQQVETDVGDFVLRRADGYYAYQLATVTDDAFQEISHVVRGADLLQSTPRQIHLQQALGLTTPEYAHLPLAVDTDGRKLSKQHRDLPVNPLLPMPALLGALAFLGQALPPETPSNVEEFWTWAIGRWDLRRIPSQTHTPPTGAWNETGRQG
jgi:glutamyl-Q tRNA(Asp) synthetase